MAITAWIVLGVCAALGLIGVFIPFIPGIALILVGAIVHKLMLPEILSWWTIAILGVCVGLNFVVDFLGSMVGARWGGAGKWGLAGALIGGIIGLFFGIPGLILGPLVGAFAAELIFARRKAKDAVKAGVGAGAGIAIATVLHLLLGLIMIGSIVVDCFL